MKKIGNITKLETREERANFFDTVWNTPMFMQMAKDPNSLVGSIKEDYIKHVRYFYHMQNKDMERSAFTSWYSVLSLKDYANDYIHDLYLLHELTHQATMPYTEGLSFDDWQAKMRKNEVEASLISEVLIYLEKPELRPLTFTQEIWADQFTSLGHQMQYKMDRDAILHEITEKRHDAYINPKTQVEKELASFKQFSYLFYDTWKQDYNSIEENVLKLQNGKDKEYDQFLLEHIGSEGVLFEDLVKKHYDNYIRLQFSRPHY